MRIVSIHRLTAAVVATALLGGCASIIPGSGGQDRRPPAPLAAAPAGAVERGQLPPPGGQQVAGVLPGGGSADTAAAEAALAGGAAPQPGGGQVAAVDPGGTVEIGRTDLLGRWTLSAGADNCDIFMTLTTWSGGYRATTRNCASPAMQGVAAWNLNGRQVALVDESGATVARLYPTSKVSFSGQTSAGVPVSFAR
ncbi:MAG TPA: AprI/Inh family metalloprotease inhibitor [Afifellaceae bacterium]|nr:AprI/Inh family metalloprotease inhibitor [Afifellaceae bacterium]